jgi:hypothetical protein
MQLMQSKHQRMGRSFHTPSGSGEISKPKKTPAPEREILVEKDQSTNAKGDDISGAKASPLPQPEPLVEDQNVIDEGRQDDTIPKPDAPNAEMGDVFHKEVNFFPFHFFTFSSNL